MVRFLGAGRSVGRSAHGTARGAGATTRVPGHVARMEALDTRTRPFFKALSATYDSLSTEARSTSGLNPAEPVRPSLLALTATRLLAQSGQMGLNAFRTSLRGVSPARHALYVGLDQAVCDALTAACRELALPLANAYASSYERKARAALAAPQGENSLMRTFFLRTAPEELGGTPSATVARLERANLADPRARPVMSNRAAGESERYTTFPDSGRLYVGDPVPYESMSAYGSDFP